MGDGAIELPLVVQRFRESTEALESLRERLQALELAEEVQGRAASALDSSAVAIADAAKAITDAATSLGSATLQTQTSMEFARQLIGASDILSLRNEVANLLEAQAITSAYLAETRTRVEQLITDDLQRARSEAAAAQAELRAMRDKVAAMPAKIRGKYGV